MVRRSYSKNGDVATPAAPAYVVPPVRELKRERKALLLVREERLRDLGGLTLEMYKRESFNAGLVVERCAELVAIEARVQEIDALLDGTVGLRVGGGTAVCTCGAPLLLARFCDASRSTGGTQSSPKPTRRPHIERLPAVRRGAWTNGRSTVPGRSPDAGTRRPGPWR